MNGQLKEKGYYKDGDFHGLSEYYYENGKLRMKINYKDGDFHGLFESYDESGQLKETYKNGVEQK